MKKFFVCISIFVLSCICFVGCDDSAPFQQTFSPRQPNNTTEPFRVYVCGAVKNEGYVEVSQGSNYNTLVEMAGKLPQTYLFQDPETLVTEDTAVLILDWFDGTVNRSCINVNGPYVTLRIEIDGIDPVVINKIADYIDENGPITDKQLLREILGKDYEDNFYKFFVSVDDYEKVS